MCIIGNTAIQISFITPNCVNPVGGVRDLRYAQVLSGEQSLGISVKTFNQVIITSRDALTASCSDTIIFFLYIHPPAEQFILSKVYC